jgi:hypothetical protein
MATRSRKRLTDEHRRALQLLAGLIGKAIAIEVAKQGMSRQHSSLKIAP